MGTILAVFRYDGNIPVEKERLINRPDIHCSTSTLSVGERKLNSEQNFAEMKRSV